MATNNFTKGNMSYGDVNLPSHLRPGNILDDRLFNSVGLYSKKDIEEARFSKFSRFGRVLDPYGKVNPGREYLFFVKPDLHLCVEGGSSVIHSRYAGVYDISGKADLSSSPKGPGGLILNPQLNNNQYFEYLLATHPNVIKELQYGLSSGDPFGHLLSFAVSSPLGLSSPNAKTMDTPANIYGSSYNYLADSAATEPFQFSLEFVDNKNLDVFHFFKAYIEYQWARKSGLVTPPNLKYYQNRMLHNTMGIYKIIVGEDMETILYWTYLYGVFPTSYPRDAFQDPNFNDGLTFSIDFEAAFVEDMNLNIINQFNMLMMNGALKNVNLNKWLPVIRHNRLPKDGGVNDHSYDSTLDPPLKDPKKIAGAEYVIGSTDMIDGTLPRGAFIDMNPVGNEPEGKYRLRWYA